MMGSRNAERQYLPRGGPARARRITKMSDVYKMRIDGAHWTTHQVYPSKTVYCTVLHVCQGQGQSKNELSVPGGDDGVVVINDLLQVAHRHRGASQLINLF
jgi:hypothetical protein